jgi:flagellin
MLSLINNLAALTAQNNLSNSNNALNISLQRLSSGLRINSGADDPAGMVISQLQLAQMSGLQTAISNASADTNVVQTADGGLNEINALLVQIRGLAVAAANSGGNDSSMLAADQAQINNALQTITRIATSTQYGQDQLLDGSHAAGVTISGGASADSATATGTTQSGSYGVAITTAATAATYTAGAAFGGSVGGTLSSSETITINGVAIGLGAGINGTQAAKLINQAQGNTGVAAQYNSTSGELTLYATQFGSGHNITVTTSAGASDATGLDASKGGTFTAGIDVQGTIGGQAATGVGNVLTSNSGPSAGLSVTFAASSTTPWTTTDTTSTTGISVNVNTDNGLIFQIGANAGQTAILTIQNVQANALGIVANNSGIANLSQIDVTNSGQSSADILSVIDKAINDVSSLAGVLGAFQDNTLQATAANLQTALQNTTAANSTIRDTNFAQESATYAQDQVLVQAGTQVLKNANQLPQLVLALLQ